MGLRSSPEPFVQAESEPARCGPQPSELTLGREEDLVTVGCPLVKGDQGLCSGEATPRAGQGVQPVGQELPGLLQPGGGGAPTAETAEPKCDPPRRCYCVNVLACSGSGACWVLETYILIYPQKSDKIHWDIIIPILS